MSIKNIFIYATLAFSAVFLAGCADDLIQGTPEVNDDSQTSSLTISLPAPTKGTFSDDGASAIKLRWALGDMVEVYELYGTDSLTFIATEIYNGGTSAKFEAPEGQTISKYCSAVYPSTAGRNSTAWYERIKYVQEQDMTNPTANLEEYLVATGMDPDGDGTIEMFPQLSIFKLVANVTSTDFAGKIPESATVWGPWGDQAFKVKFTSATAASGTIAAYIVTKPALPSSSAVPVHAVINGTNSATDNTKGALISYETSKTTQAAISTFVLSAPKSNVGYVQLYAGGPKWAIRNVGASSATDKGDWFSWGMPNSYSEFSTSNNNYTTSSLSDLSSLGVIDANNRLVSDYDAATVQWGSLWKLPTVADANSLIDNNNTNYTPASTSDNGSPAVFTFTGKSSYSNNSISLPKTSWKERNSEQNYPNRSFYILSDATDENTTSVRHSYKLYMYGNTKQAVTYFRTGSTALTNQAQYRYYGYKIRAVINDNVLPSVPERTESPSAVQSVAPGYNSGFVNNTNTDII